jgi:LPS export ABC transporter protein LptC
MAAWQRRARVLIAVVGIAGAVFVAFQVRPRPLQAPVAPVPRSDPKAIVETGRGESSRTSRTFEQGRIEYDSSRTYDDNSVKLFGVKIITERSSRTFTIVANEASIGKNESEATLVGDVQVSVSDGLTMRMATATHNDADGMVRSPGPVQFARGRMHGSATGMTYNKAADILNLMEKVTVHVSPGETGADALRIDAASAEFNRPEHIIRFNGQMKAVRRFETITADAAVAFLGPDEEQLDRLELRGNSRILGSRPGAGALREMRGDDIDLDYADDGQAIQYARLRGNALMSVSGEPPAGADSLLRRRNPVTGTANREIIANRIDLTVAPDGATPTAILANTNVQLTVPGTGGAPTRVINAESMNATGNDRQGLTNARFEGKIQFRERGEATRTASSDLLDVTLAPALSSIDEAQFTRNVSFVDGNLTATSSAARYVLDRGMLHLTGSDTTPRIRDDRIDVRATAMDLEFDGPHIVAKGNVRTVLLPASKREKGKTDLKMPSMLKQDREVNVNAESLNYDGKASQATFTGGAHLFQAASETRIRAASITLDDKSGDLTASGNVVTNSILVDQSPDGKKTREKSEGSSKEFRYQEASRLATYEENARLVGMRGTLEAKTIELYLKPSGDEIDLALGHEAVTFTETKRKATGNEFQYYAVDDRYELQGTPVVIIDECGKPTRGLFLVYFRRTDKMTIDGGDVARTESRGNRSTCP